MPVLYVVPGLRRRLRATAETKLDQLAGALVGRAPADLGWRLSETLRGLAVVYGLEVHAGRWPAGARPSLRLHRRRVVGAGAERVPEELLAALAELQVESWEAVVLPDAPAFRFTPLGACQVVSIFPPMRYTRGLNDEEARLVLEIADLSARVVGLRRPG